MKRPEICAVLVNNDLQQLAEIENLADLFEIRIDLIGAGWPDVAAQLKKPWIATNRGISNAGNWHKSEKERIRELLKAVSLGASIIDIEYDLADLKELISEIKPKARILLSYHDWVDTPSTDKLSRIVQQQLEAGADICKIATTACKFEDNLSVLKLFNNFRVIQLTAFCMGSEGILSRIMCPLMGGCFTYGSIQTGRESAPGQVTVAELRRFYGMLTI